MMFYITAETICTAEKTKTHSNTTNEASLKSEIQEDKTNPKAKLVSKVSNRKTHFSLDFLSTS